MAGIEKDEGTERVERKWAISRSFGIVSLLSRTDKRLEQSFFQESRVAMDGNGTRLHEWPPGGTQSPVIRVATTFFAQALIARPSAQQSQTIYRAEAPHTHGVALATNWDNPITRLLDTRRSCIGDPPVGRCTSTRRWPALPPRQ